MFFIFCILLCSALPMFGFPDDSRENGTDSAHINALVREVVQNEIDMQLHDTSLWCFREEKEEDSKPRKTLEVCGTHDGDLERVVAVNGRELSAAELQAEDQRLSKLISHPAQLRAKQKKQREDEEQFQNLLKAIPEAFRFQIDGSDGTLLKLKFRPNPAYRPATRAETVFHHMEGTFVIDRKQKRLAEVNGRITSEVKFVGGLLGHLDKGGTFLVKAGEVTPGHWDSILTNLDLSGKALFFKALSVHQKETYADYTRVPNGATLEQVAELLRKECGSIRTAASH